MNEKLESLQNSGSVLELGQAVNVIAGNALFLGFTLVVFLVMFYRLSPEGYVPAFTASSFTTSILAFIFASGGLMPVELPFLFALGSVGSAAFMYMNQRV